jgi:ketosteroid isomerase-like protein
MTKRISEEEDRMQAFRNAIERRDLDGLVELFKDDVEFRSPAVHTPYRGRVQVKELLAAVDRVLEDFRFTRRIGAPDGPDHALVFRARVGDREVEGCDFLHVDEDGMIDELYVMFRPLSGLTAMAEAMKRQLVSGERTGRV